MIKLYANALSTPSRRVLYVLEALGADYELQEMDFQSGEMKSDAYRAKHPAGKVPAMDDGDVTLFESGAICRYLCEKHESALFPKDLVHRALVMEWEDFSVLHVGNAINKVTFNTIIAPKFNLPIDETSLKEGRQWLNRYLPIVEAQIAENDGFLVRGTLSLADITLVAFLDLSAALDLDVSAYPNLSAWLRRIQDMPFWKAVEKPA